MADAFQVGNGGQGTIGCSFAVADVEIERGMGQLCHGACGWQLDRLGAFSRGLSRALGLAAPVCLQEAAGQDL